MYGLFDWYSNRGDLEPALPSFSCQAPLTDYEISENDDDGIAERKRKPLVRAHPSSVQPSAIEINLREETTKISKQLQLRAHQQLSKLQRCLEAFDADENLGGVQQVSQRFHHELPGGGGPVSMERELADRREELRAFLRKKHQAQAEKESTLITELEEQEKRARERAEKESRAKPKETEERGGGSDTAPSSVAVAHPEGLSVEPSGDKGSKSSISKVKASSHVERFKLRGSSEALIAFNRSAEQVSLAEEVANTFQADPSMKDAKRAINKFITLNVQQISATVEQVVLKTKAFVGYLSQHREPQRVYAMLSLASKLLSQCEVQITRLHSFAFPLAEVIVGVGCSHNEFMSLFLGRLHAACPLTVPLIYEATDGSFENETKLRMGYRVFEDAGNAGGGKVFESIDDYLARVQGYVMLYAAITQSSQPSNPHGLQHAWAFMARLLNNIPTSRVTATCLDAFLKIAGYRLAQRYGRQFSKLLHVVQNEFLKELDSAGDSNTRAVSSRIRTYIATQRYASPPEGWQMPQRDVSSYDRA